MWALYQKTFSSQLSRLAEAIAGSVIMRRTLAVVGVVAAALLSGVGEAGRIWPQPKSVVWGERLCEA